METLRVGAGFPDPPFNGMRGRNGGLDIDLMTAIAESLCATVEFVPYDGGDFNGIFDALGSAYDCVAAGTTVTPDRETKAQFVPPYLISGQSLARRYHPAAGCEVHRRPREPHHRRAAGQHHQPIADELVVQGKAANVRVCDYDNIRTALTDLTTGGCDAVMKLAPVLTELVKPIPGVEVVQRGISVEKIAIAVPLNDQALLGRITVAQSWKTTARCSGSVASGWAIRSPTRT